MFMVYQNLSYKMSGIIAQSLHHATGIKKKPADKKWAKCANNVTYLYNYVTLLIIKMPCFARWKLMLESITTPICLQQDSPTSTLTIYVKHNFNIRFQNAIVY